MKIEIVKDRMPKPRPDAERPPGQVWWWRVMDDEVKVDAGWEVSKENAYAAAMRCIRAERKKREAGAVPQEE